MTSLSSPHSGGLITTTRMTTCDASLYTLDFKKMKEEREREKPWVKLASLAFWIIFFSSRLTLLVSEINVFGQPVTCQQPLTFTAGCLSGDVDADRLSPWYHNPLVLDWGGAALGKRTSGPQKPRGRPSGYSDCANCDSDRLSSTSIYLLLEINCVCSCMKLGHKL